MNFADTLARRDPCDPCPTCEMVGGYCGGENHPSCGLFDNGRPVAAQRPDEVTPEQWQALAEALLECVQSRLALAQAQQDLRDEIRRGDELIAQIRANRTAAALPEQQEDSHEVEG